MLRKSEKDLAEFRQVPAFSVTQNVIPTGRERTYGAQDLLLGLLPRHTRMKRSLFVCVLFISVFATEFLTSVH